MSNNGIARRDFFLGLAGLGAAALVPSDRAIASVLSGATHHLYGPPDGIAKLDANENPYGPSPGALKAMAEATRLGAYYVKESAQRLREMIAERHELTPDHIMLSSGSSGALTYLAMAASKEGHILAPDLFWDTTSLMGVRNSAHQIKRIENGSLLSIDLPAMEKSLSNDISLIHLTNPNNPTGTALDSAELISFCERASKKCLVLVDEAYNELTEDPKATTVIPLIKAGKNIAVARTFSKIYGMAGMRLGYLIANPDLLESVGQFGLGDYGLNQAGVAGAIASYNDEPFLAYSKSKVVEAREMVTDSLKSNGLSALPSQTNFMFVDLKNINAEKFRSAMADKNVMIRGIYRDYLHWSRVSMGKIEHIEMYVDALPSVLDSMT